MRLALIALTALTFLIHGYHPLAEDGGLYVVGIEYKLDPTLFPHYTAFVTEHLRLSLFAPAIVAIVRLSHIPLAWTLLFVDLFSIALTLHSARRILTHCIASQPAQLAGLCLLSAFWTLPIAGTSLLLMDPYVTARSFSTPLSLLAVAFALTSWNRSRVPHSSARAAHFGCALSLILAALFHPLMAIYAFAFILVLRLTRVRRQLLVQVVLLLGTLALAITLNALAPPESPALLTAEFSRDYWFFLQWQWFEVLGLLAPLAIFAWLYRHNGKQASPHSQATAALCRASLNLGFITIAVALLFTHRDAAKHFVARMQPLRTFLLAYALMAILLGATLFQLISDHLQRTTSLRARRFLTPLPAAALLALAATMFTVQRLSFPASPHLELPWLQPSQNPWTQAFLWARDNTPRDALFALDAKYIHEPGEDAHTFPATALRSSLPDYTKDGGEAANNPSLAASWQPAATAQSHLYTLTDTARDARILPLGATWIVLHSTTPTVHTCPYDNGTVKICHLQS
jgi:hypothetical protein